MDIEMIDRKGVRIYYEDVKGVYVTSEGEMVFELVEQSPQGHAPLSKGNSSEEPEVSEDEPLGRGESINEPEWKYVPKYRRIGL